jgi:pyruvate/2-oxoglutarate/acetoin dehydrogenase E1 component
VGVVLTYFEEITKAMTMLAKHPKTLFVGQSVEYGGQRAFKTFEGVPAKKRIEMPICEDMTVGFCTGLALEGYIPVCFIPRWDFLLLAANQIVNHLDKIPLLGDFRPKVIIRTAVGTNRPINPGPQHTQDYTEPFKLMCRTLIVARAYPEYVARAYDAALRGPHSTIVVEQMEHY